MAEREDAAKTPLDVDAMDRLCEFERKLGNVLKLAGRSTAAGRHVSRTEGHEPQVQSGERKR
jgi:hypothetical protein